MSVKKLLHCDKFASETWQLIFTAPLCLTFREDEDLQVTQ